MPTEATEKQATLCIYKKKDRGKKHCLYDLTAVDTFVFSVVRKPWRGTCGK